MFQLKNQWFVRAGLGLLPLIGTLAGVVAEVGQDPYGVVVSKRDSAGVSNPIRYQPLGLATQMFARIGVAWPVGRPRETHKPIVELATSAGRRA